MTIDQNTRDLACALVSTFFSAEGSEDDMMIATLTTHLPDLAKLPAIRDLVLSNYHEPEVEQIAKALHDRGLCKDPWPSCDDPVTKYYRNRAKIIHQIIHAEPRIITLNQLKPDMRIRVEFSDESVLREYTMLVKDAVHVATGAWVSANPTGRAWVPDNAKIIWLDGTEPAPVDPDAEEIEAMAQAIYRNNSVRYCFTFSWDETTDASRNEYRDNARAALTAQRNHNNRKD